MKILFIAPVPPPVTGHSLAAEVLLRELEKNHQVSVVNLNKKSMSEGVDSIGRIFEVLRILIAVMFRQKGKDIGYLTISESLAGNLKDIVIYMLCFFKLKNFFIHLHGGTIGKELFSRHPLLRRINGFFLKRIRGAIILGESHRQIFKDLIPAEKIHCVPNFAEDYIFLPRQKILKKFSKTRPVKIVYISGMVPGKGYLDLLEAYHLLPRSAQNQLNITFAGRFETPAAKEHFLQRIAPTPQIEYAGEVSGNLKKIIFNEAHAFILPTGYSEGQPISIIEAYASGCVVCATENGGIPDIFTNEINGFAIGEKSPAGVRSVLQHLLLKKTSLYKIAAQNRKLAESHFRLFQHLNRMVSLLTNQPSELNHPEKSYARI